MAGFSPIDESDDMTPRQSHATLSRSCNTMQSQSFQTPYYPQGQTDLRGARAIHFSGPARLTGGDNFHLQDTSNRDFSSEPSRLEQDANPPKPQQPSNHATDRALAWMAGNNYHSLSSILEDYAESVSDINTVSRSPELGGIRLPTAHDPFLVRPSRANNIFGQALVVPHHNGLRGNANQFFSRPNDSGRALSSLSHGTNHTSTSHTENSSVGFPLEPPSQHAHAADRRSSQTSLSQSQLSVQNWKVDHALSEETAKNRKLQMVYFIQGGGLEKRVTNATKTTTSTKPINSDAEYVPSSSNGSQYHRTQQDAAFGQGPPNAPQDLGHVINQMVANGGPTHVEARQWLPCIDATQFAGPSLFGVVKIIGIPYEATQQEIVAAVGDRTPLEKMPAASGTFAVHIICERSTGKSMECYVELTNHEAAEQMVNRIAKFNGSRRIGSRRIQFQLSSQAELMQHLFPRTKCVTWHGQHPVINEPIDQYSSDFQGFLAGEEIVMLRRYAEVPRKSRFADRHRERIFESMISILVKYPWWATDCYTVEERDSVYDTTCHQLRAFKAHMGREGVCGRWYQRDYYMPDLDRDVILFQSLLHAALMVPAFNERQKVGLIDAAAGILPFPPIWVTPSALDWPFQALSRHPAASEAMIQYFAQLFSTIHLEDNYNGRTDAAISDGTVRSNSSFGRFFVFHHSPDLGHTTFDQAIAYELSILEEYFLANLQS